VNYDNSPVVTITVTCYLWTPSSGDHLFACGAIYPPPQYSWSITLSISRGVIFISLSQVALLATSGPFV